MEIRYTVTLEDYREANRLWYMNSTFRRKLNYLLYVRFGLPIGAVLLIVGAAGWVLNLRGSIPESGGAMAFLTGAVAWIGIVFFICPFSYKRKTARLCREMNFPVERTATVSGSSLLITRADGAAETRYTWPYFEKPLESDSLFVLLPSRRQFVALPKRAMSAEQQQEFRTLLAAHLPGGAGTPATRPALSWYPGSL